LYLSLLLQTILKKHGLGKEVLWECPVRRAARAAVQCEPLHPLLPLYWQLFFYTYFAKVKLDVGAGERYGAGNVCNACTSLVTTAHPLCQVIHSHSLA